MSLINLSIFGVALASCLFAFLIVFFFFFYLNPSFFGRPSKLIYYPFYWVRVIYDYSEPSPDMHLFFLPAFLFVLPRLPDRYKCVGVSSIPFFLFAVVVVSSLKFRSFWTFFLRVVAVDLRGYGDSDKPNGRDAYKMDRLVDDVRQIIGILGMRRGHIRPFRLTICLLFINSRRASPFFSWRLNCYFDRLLLLLFLNLFLKRDLRPFSGNIVLYVMLFSLLWASQGEDRCGLCRKSPFQVRSRRQIANWPYRTRGIRAPSRTP